MSAMMLLILATGDAAADPGASSSANAAPEHYASCAACHGAAAEGNPALGAPALAGQLEVYLKRQLMLFRRGLRGGAEGDSLGAQMQAFANQLPDEAAVGAIAAWLAALAPPSTAGSAPAGDARRGASLYNGNCGACHGASAEGNEALKAPRLAGLDSAYLRRQFEHFLSGQRGSDPRDRLGRQMATMATTLTDEAALDDILAHIATLAAGSGAAD